MCLYYLAYKDLKKIDGFTVERAKNEELPENTWPFFADQRFPEKDWSLENGACYRYAGKEWFNLALETPEDWRLGKLAHLVSYNQSTQKYEHGPQWAEDAGPFFHLFTECSGIFGSNHSAKLAEDFEKWNLAAQALGDISFYDWYRNMHAMFEYVGKNGAIHTMNDVSNVGWEEMRSS